MNRFFFPDRHFVGKFLYFLILFLGGQMLTWIFVKKPDKQPHEAIFRRRFGPVETERCECVIELLSSPKCFLWTVLCFCMTIRHHYLSNRHHSSFPSDGSLDSDWRGTCSGGVWSCKNRVPSIKSILDYSEGR